MNQNIMFIKSCLSHYTDTGTIYITLLIIQTLNYRSGMTAER